MKSSRLKYCMAILLVTIAPAYAVPSLLDNILSSIDSLPDITTAYLDKTKYQLGDQMLITAAVSDDWGIQKVEAQVENENGWDTVDMIVLAGNSRKGTWQGAWKVHDTLGVKEYTTKIIATDLSGQTAEKTLLWIDPVQSHPAEQIRAGIFQSGNYKFPDGLGIGADAAASDKLKVVKTSTGGNAINANCATGTGNCDAVYAVSDGGIGVKGTSTSNYGVYGYTSSNTKAGVMGDGGSGTGVYGSSSGGSGVYGSTSGNSAAGIYGYNPSSWGFGVKGDAPSGTGVIGTSTVYGVEGLSGTGTGVWGASTSGNGVLGTSDSATGVWGGSQTGNGVYGSTNGNGASGVFGNNGGAGNGVAGISNTGTGIYGKSTSGYSGYFEGGTGVKIANGGLTVSSGNVCIGTDCRSSWPTGGDNLGNHLATTTLGMNGNKIDGVSSIVLSPQSSAPASPVRGQMYFDSSANRILVYNGSIWLGISAAEERLSGGLHTPSQCTASGGGTVLDGTEKFCRFNLDTCPSTWVQYKSYTTTTSNGCGGSCGDSAVSCTTTYHNFSNDNTIETCQANHWVNTMAGDRCFWYTCYATRSQIGCY